MTLAIRVGRVRLMRALLVSLFLLVPALSQAQSIEAAKALIANYHEDLSRLDRARDLMEKFLKTCLLYTSPSPRD